MVISQPPENNPSYYYRTSPTLPQLLWMLPETPYILCNYNIRVTHRNGAVKHIFYTNRIHGGIISRLFFIHFVAPCTCSSSAVEILLQIFLYEDLSTLYTYICQLYFPPECQQDRTLLLTILLSENIPNIWHKSSTKHKEVRPDWNDKNDNANYAPSYHMEGLPMAQVAIFKEIFDQVRKKI